MPNFLVRMIVWEAFGGSQTTAQSRCLNPCAIPSDEVGGQPPVTKGIQPPPPEPDGHGCVHPALQCRVLRMKVFSPLRATSILVELSTCPPSSCPGHYPRR